MHASHTFPRSPSIYIERKSIRLCARAIASTHALDANVARFVSSRVHSLLQSASVVVDRSCAKLWDTTVRNFVEFEGFQEEIWENFAVETFVDCWKVWILIKFCVKVKEIRELWRKTQVIYRAWNYALLICLWDVLDHQNTQSGLEVNYNSARN